VSVPAINRVADGSRENPVVFFDENGNGPCYHVCADEAPSNRARRIIDRWTYTRGLTNSEKALLEELVSELEAGR